MFVIIIIIIPHSLLNDRNSFILLVLITPQPSFSSFFNNRYYRANSVRYETKPCDKVCLLNHYCAITRIDYREFKQCLDDSVAALASVKSNVLNINYQISLLLIVFIQLLLNRHMVLRILRLT